MILTIRSIRVAVETVVTALAPAQDAQASNRDSPPQETRDEHG